MLLKYIYSFLSRKINRQKTQHSGKKPTAKEQIFRVQLGLPKKTFAYKVQFLRSGYGM
jgi:hypothetical protein